MNDKQPKENPKKDPLAKIVHIHIGPGSRAPKSVQIKRKICPRPSARTIYHYGLPIKECRECRSWL